MNLLKKLALAGSDEGKFMRMIVCYVDIVSPLYHLKELDTYRIGVEKNSCSTMHTIHKKPFVPDDFSHEDNLSASHFSSTIDLLNRLRDNFNETKDKAYWRSLIQTLPSSYNQRRTYMFSYAALRNIYHARRNHKLEEWREFCRWIETLPYSELITNVE